MNVLIVSACCTPLKWSLYLVICQMIFTHFFIHSIFLVLQFYLALFYFVLQFDCTLILRCCKFCEQAF